MNNPEELSVGGPTAKTGKRNYRKKQAHIKKLGDQLTYQSEQNVLAEIDIYTFLGMVCNAIKFYCYYYFPPSFLMHFLKWTFKWIEQAGGLNLFRDISIYISRVVLRVIFKSR